MTGKTDQMQQDFWAAGGGAATLLAYTFSKATSITSVLLVDFPLTDIGVKVLTAGLVAISGGIFGLFAKDVYGVVIKPFVYNSIFKKPLPKEKDKKDGED